MDVVQPKYRRILLKMSGEALSGDGASAISPQTVNRMAAEVAEVYQLGVQIGIVVGGGNFFRGEQLSKVGISRVTGDQMGMLATMMNALALRDAFEQIDMPTTVMSSVPAGSFFEQFNFRRAQSYLQQGRVIIFAGGTGNPLVTTDSTASLRGIEIGADILVKATNVDGIYNTDPHNNPNAKRYAQITFDECLKNELAVMDLTSFCQCRDNNLPVIVFNFTKPGSLMRVIAGENEGTLVEVTHDK